MGNKGGRSWFTAVKRVFRSPTKDSVKKNSCLKVEHEQDDEEEKKREKRRWLFSRKASSMNDIVTEVPSKTPVLPSEQRHAIAVAAATASAAEAAVATAQAAVEIMRLTRSSNSLKQHQAATIIQTSFRGFLGRRALVALRGIVKLQALIRGQNVRKQAKMTLKCMQALLKVQARLRDQRARLSHDGGRRSMFYETTNHWESRYLQDIRERKSTCRDGSGSIGNEWSECPRTLEELDAILEAKNQASFRRERSLTSAFSQQLWDDNELVEERPSWIERGTPTPTQWDTISRGSTDRRDSIKTVEIDTLKPYSSSYLSPTISRKSQYSSPLYKQTTQHIASSPRQRPQNYFSPSPSRGQPMHTRPASPRFSERSYSTANTPSLRSLSRGRTSEATNAAVVPNYMAATESAKAKSRSQSAPRSRPSTPERDIRGGLARKRLSYPLPEHVSYGCNNSGYSHTRNPEERSDFSFNTDGIGGEISPCSATDLRRFLRR